MYIYIYPISIISIFFPIKNDYSSIFMCSQISYSFNGRKNNNNEYGRTPPNNHGGVDPQQQEHQLLIKRSQNVLCLIDDVKNNLDMVGLNWVF